MSFCCGEGGAIWAPGLLCCTLFLSKLLYPISHVPLVCKNKSKGKCTEEEVKVVIKIAPVVTVFLWLCLMLIKITSPQTQTYSLSKEVNFYYWSDILGIVTEKTLSSSHCSQGRKSQASDRVVYEQHFSKVRNGERPAYPFINKHQDFRFTSLAVSQCREWEWCGSFLIM